MTKILAIDAGGTKIYYAQTDETGRFLTDVKKADTPKQIDDLIALFKNIIGAFEKDIDYTAFAAAGAVNIENTKVESSTPNMPKGFNALDFSSLSRKPVFVENDASAAAWAEYILGSAKGADNTITVTLGTGVGGGIITDGKLMRGYTGKGGEIGSMKIKSAAKPDRICTCGRRNCFESYASGTGLKATANETALYDEIFKSSIYKTKKPEDITTYDIINGLKLNDAYSIKVFDIWKQDVTTGLINLANIFNPERIILSGGLGQFLDVLEIERAVNDETVVSPVKIKHAAAGNYAGMKGAALLAYKTFSARKSDIISRV